jgi:hypothetical protein
MSPATPALDRDTFLTLVYCLVDDLYQRYAAPHKPRRPGRRPELSDSEVLTLALLAQWRPGNSEYGFWAYADAHLRPYFPRLLSRSALNRRIRDLTGVLALLGPALAEQAGGALGLAPPAYEVVDGAPVPLMQRCRGTRHRVFTTEAGIGKGGPQKAWYYGVEQLVVVDSRGFLTGFVVGPAQTDERLLVEGLLRYRADPRAALPTGAELLALLGPTHGAGGQRQGPAGPLGPSRGAGQPSDRPLLGDLGFRGTAWHQHWAAAFGTTVLTEQTLAERGGRLATPAFRRAFHGARQVVERAIGRLAAVFHLPYPRARSRAGLWARLSAKVAAYNALLYVNLALGRPTEAHFSPLP